MFVAVVVGGGGGGGGDGSIGVARIESMCLKTCQNKSGLSCKATRMVVSTVFKFSRNPNLFKVNTNNLLSLSN